jgi:hypothetical protein
MGVAVTGKQLIVVLGKIREMSTDILAKLFIIKIKLWYGYWGKCGKNE